MSKKRIQKRLDKLFTDIKQDEVTTPVETTARQARSRRSATSGDAARQFPALTEESRTPIQQPAISQAEVDAMTAAQTPGEAPPTLALPFRMDADNWGILEISNPTEERGWSHEEQQLIKQVVDQLALALENARLFQQSQIRAEELAVLNEMGHALTTQLEVDAILQNIYSYTSRLLDTTNFHIALYDSENDEISFPLAIEGNERTTIPPRRGSQGLDEYLIHNKQSLMFEDQAADRSRALGIEMIGVEPQSFLGVPMVLGDLVIGVISVQSYTQPNLYNQHAANLLTTIASQSAIALQNARLLQETRRRNEELSALNEIIGAASRSLELTGILEEVLTKLLSAMGLDAGLISMLNPATQSLELGVSHGLPESITKQLKSQGLEGTLCQAVFNTADAIAIEDLSRGAPIDVSELLAAGFKAYLGVPLEARGKVLGTLCTFKKSPMEIRPNTIELIRSIGRQIGFAIENARLFQQTQIHAEELATLNELGRALASRLGLEQVLDEVFRGVSRLIDTTNFYIGLYDPIKQEVTFRLNVTESTIDKEIVVLPSDQGITGYIIRTKDTILLKERVMEWQAEKGIPTVGEPAMSWLGVPILLGNQVLGVMAVQNYKEPFAYDEHDRDLLVAIANQASIAIQNARLFEETHTRAEELATLNELGSALASRLSLDRVLEEVFRGVSRLIETTNFYIGLHDPLNHTVSFRLNSTESTIDKEIVSLPADQGITGYIIRTQEPVLIKEKVVEWLEEKGIPTVGEPAMSWLGVPILLGNQVLGVMAVQNYKEPFAYDEHDRDMLVAIANQASIAIQNARLFEETHTRAEELATLNELGSALASRLSLDRVLDEVLRGASRLIDATNFFIGIYNPETQQVTFRLGVTESEIDKKITSMPADQGITGYIIRTREPVLVKEKVVEWLEEKGIAAVGEPAMCWLGVPILLGDQVLGVMLTQNYKVPFAYNEHDRDVLIAIANQAAIAIQNARLFEDIQASETRFRDVAFVSADYVWECNKQWEYTYVSERVKDVLGYEPVEMLGKTDALFTTEEEAERVIRTMEEKISSGEQVIDLENWLWSKDGRKVTLSTSAVPIRDSEGNIVGFRGVDKDITERKRFEETLRRQNQYLGIAAEIGRLVTSTLDMDLIFNRTVNLIHDRFGYYHAAIFTIEETGYNAVLRAATGAAGEEMKRRQHALAVGSRSIVGTVTSTGNSLAVNNTALDPIHHPNPLLPETRAEAAIPLKVGKRIIGAIDIQAKQIDAFSEDDIVILQTLGDQIAIAIDNARSYDLAQQAVTEMRALDQIKTQFLANMSHELRTPLNSIIGFSRVILKGIDGPVTELQQQDLNAIYNSGQHLLRLINDILDLSKIEAGKMELSFDDLNITDTINSVVPTISGLIKDKPIRLKKTIAANIPIVRADIMRIRQVLINLLSNAAKFTEEGMIEIDASVRSDSTGQPEIMISIRDTGPGISSEDQAKLFQPFSQVDTSPTRKTGGSGLGLSISRHLIEMHGGRIGVHSTVGEGSTFYFTLPIIRASEKAEEEKAPGKARVILAIDDDIQVIGLYERYLQPQGYQIVSQTDATKAKAQARQLKPYAITLDIMMPGCDGWAILTDLKTDPETRDIPVIICSMLEDEEKGLSLGASDYLVKPILETDLAHALNRLSGENIIREVLVIDDDPDDLRLIARMLDAHGRYKVVLAEGGRQGWERLSASPPDAIVLDLFMPEVDGFIILERIDASTTLRGIPVVVTSGVDLNAEQLKKLQSFGRTLMNKGSLSETELITHLDKALSRFKPTPKNKE